MRVHMSDVRSDLARPLEKREQRTGDPPHAGSVAGPHQTGLGVRLVVGLGDDLELVSGEEVVDRPLLLGAAVAHSVGEELEHVPAVRMTHRQPRDRRIPLDLAELPEGPSLAECREHTETGVPAAAAILSRDEEAVIDVEDSARLASGKRGECGHGVNNLLLFSSTGASLTRVYGGPGQVTASC